MLFLAVDDFLFIYELLLRKEYMYERTKSEPTDLPKTSVVIDAVLPCDDLRQRLRKIYTLAIARYEKKSVFNKPVEEWNEI